MSTMNWVGVFGLYILMLWIIPAVAAFLRQKGWVDFWTGVIIFHALGALAFMMIFFIRLSIYQLPLPEVQRSTFTQFEMSMIQPYYQDSMVTLYCGDCREILPQLDVKADLCLTDPPYGLNEKMNGGTWGKRYTNDDMQNWDFVMPFLDIDIVTSMARHRIVWGGNNYPFRPSRCWLVWVKPQIPTLSDVELAWTDFDAPSKMFSWTRIQHNGHPTEKPLFLMRWCIENYSKEGQLILDPFAGSGTTLVAAKLLKRKSIGIEISPAYCKIIVDRLNKPIPLFDQPEQTELPLTTSGVQMTKVEDMRLVIAGLSGTPYIATLSKREVGVMNATRREIPKGEWIKAMIEWCENNYQPSETIELKRNGEVIFEINCVKKSAGCR